MHRARLGWFVAVAVGLGVAFGLGHAGEEAGLSESGVQGVVTTASGRPLEGAVVSAFSADARDLPAPAPEPMPPAPVPERGAGSVSDPAASVQSGDADRQGVYDAAGRAVNGGASGRMPVRLLQARTDRDGRFRMQLPSGRYVLQVAAPGFRTVYCGGASALSEAAVVAVGDWSLLVDVAVALEPIATLSGRVTDADTGAPVAAGDVVAERLDPRDGFRRPAGLLPGGRYLIEGLEPGVYRVRVLAQGYLTAFYEGGERSGLVDVAAGDRIAGVDIAAAGGLAISGRVMDADEAPMPGATVVASPLVGEGRAQAAQAGRDGAYRVSGLTPGTYWVTAGKPGYGRVFFGDVKARDRAIPVRVTQEAQPAEVDFQLKPVGSILGRVVARTGGEPAAGAAVTATPKGGEKRRQVQADASGNYLISDLPAADYIVYVSARDFVPQFYAGALMASAAQPVRVLSNAHTAGIDFSLGRLGRVSGKVTDRAGQAVAGARVWLVQHSAEAAPESDPASAGAMYPRAMLSGETGEDGAYRLALVPPGTYMLQATAKGFATGAYVTEPSAGSAAISVGVEQEVSGMDVALPRLGVISGQISSADGGVLEEVEVAAESASGQDADRDPVQPVVFRGEITDSEKGIYRIAGLPDGAYIVRAKARGYVAVWHDGAERPSDAVRLQAKLEQTVSGVDFALTRGGAISGYVLADRTGTPVPRAAVSAQRLGEPGTWRAESGRDGAYELTGLPGGSYLVSVQAGGFIGEFYRDTPKPDLATPIAVTAQKPVTDLILGLAERSPADFDADGDVDFTDLVMFLQKVMARPSGENAVFDLDRNGRVDFEDFLAMVRLMQGAGKAASESGALRWRSLGGQPDEVLAGLEAESMPASRGYVVRVLYDPDEARFLGAERAKGGLWEDATFLAFEEAAGAIVVSEGSEAGEGVPGDGALAQLRFRPLGEADGVTLRTEAGVALVADGKFVPLRLPEAQRLEVPPKAFRLHQNVPNPFNPATAVAFDLPEEVHVQLEVYNLVGQRVRILVSEVRPAGRYQVSWDGQNDLGRDVSSGVYFYRLTAGQFRATRRMMLLR